MARGELKARDLPSDLDARTLCRVVRLAWEGDRDGAAELLRGILHRNAIGQMEYQRMLFARHIDQLMLLAGYGKEGRAFARLTADADPALGETYRDAMIRQFGVEQD